MQKIIAVDGYKAFTGLMRIDWQIAIERIQGDWLYRPDTNCWYCRGESYPAEICTILEVQ